VLREVVQLSGAFPTEENAGQIIDGLAPALDRIASDYGRLADEVWRKEYCNSSLQKI
jgi:hypothetical protein